MLITGYQFNAEGEYIGEYKFHDNEDKKETHLPPFTTLKKPKFKKGETVKWDGFEWKVEK